MSNKTYKSFTTNISNQFYDYKITFVNSQHENTNSNGILTPRVKKQGFFFFGSEFDRMKLRFFFTFKILTIL